jgi:hypothetical protein
MSVAELYLYRKPQSIGPAGILGYGKRFGPLANNVDLLVGAFVQGRIMAWKMRPY